MSYYWLIWVAVFLAAVFFIRRLRIFVRIVYLKNPDTHTFSVTVSLFKRLKLYTLKISPPDFFRNNLPTAPPQGMIQDTPQSIFSQDMPQSTLSQGMPQNTLSQDTPQSTFSQDMPQSTFSQDMTQSTLSQGMPQNTLSQGMPQNTLSQDMPQSTFSQDMPQSTLSQDMPQNTLSQGMPQGTLQNTSQGTLQGTPPSSEYKSGTPAGQWQKLLCGKNNFSLPRKFWDKLAASIYFEKFRFVLAYGFDDAALTGVSNGLLAASRGFFLAVCVPYLKMKENPEISFNPVYGDARLEIEFDCIFNIMLGNVIVIAASAISGYFDIFKKCPKFIQGGEARWRNILSRT